VAVPLKYKTYAYTLIGNIAAHAALTLFLGEKYPVRKRPNDVRKIPGQINGENWENVVSFKPPIRIGYELYHETINKGNPRKKNIAPMRLI
jgi:hypothetical protein